MPMGLMTGNVFPSKTEGHLTVGFCPAHLQSVILGSILYTMIMGVLFM